MRKAATINKIKIIPPNINQSFKLFSLVLGIEWTPIDKRDNLNRPDLVALTSSAETWLGDCPLSFSIIYFIT